MLLLFSLLMAYLAYGSFTTRHLDDRKIRANQFADAAHTGVARFLDLSGSYHDKSAAQDVQYVVTGGGIGSCLSFVAGITSGMLGVGGGVVKVSAMNRFMNVPMKVAVGTSKLMIGITAAVSSAVFFASGLIEFALVAPVALGTTVGATVGTLIMNRLPSSLLKWIFSILVIYIGYSMLARALFLRLGMSLPHAG